MGEALRGYQSKTNPIMLVDFAGIKYTMMQ